MERGKKSVRQFPGQTLPSPPFMTPAVSSLLIGAGMRWEGVLVSVDSFWTHISSWIIIPSPHTHFPFWLPCWLHCPHTHLTWLEEGFLSWNPASTCGLAQAALHSSMGQELWSLLHLMQSLRGNKTMEAMAASKKILPKCLSQNPKSSIKHFGFDAGNCWNSLYFAKGKIRKKWVYKAQQDRSKCVKEKI